MRSFLDFEAMLRIAVIGCGLISRFHIPAIQGCNIPTRIAALVDTNIEKAEAAAARLDSKPKPRVFGCVTEALEWGEFEATDVLLPHDLHETVALQCLHAGKHVLLEKPLAHTQDSCERLLQAAEEVTREKATVFMVAENAQYWPEVVHAKQLVREGKIGELYYAKAHYWESLMTSAFSDDYKDTPDKIDWKFDAKRVGGGVLVDGSTHWLRPLRMWMGEVEEVVGVTGYDSHKAIQGESMANALIRFKSGKCAEFEGLVTQAAVNIRPFFRLFGQMGEITIDGSFSGGMTLYNHEHPKGLAITNLGGFLASYQPEIDDFVSAIVNRSAPKASARHALGELEIAWAIYRSVESKRWEKVN